MTIPGNATALLLPSTNTQYQVQRSLRFNSSDSASCSRVVSTSGDRKKWTWSGWAKRSKLGATGGLFGSVISSGLGGSWAEFIFNSVDGLGFQSFASGGYNWYWRTNAVFRDTSAWYHVMIVCDQTETSVSNAIKFYVNGVLATHAETPSTWVTNQSLQVNAANTHNIGKFDWTAEYFSGYLTEIHFIDGQALTPSSFAETNSVTGQWVPKAYAGSYGTNGFKLTFSDNSNTTAATLGKDSSPNGNNWTPTNFSVAAGAGNDSLVDTPSSGSQVDTGLGGQVTGNYCTWNPLDNPSGKTYSNGNLDVTSTSGAAYGTIAVSSGKWYWEILANGVGGEQIGIADAGLTLRGSNSTGGWTYDASQGRKVNNNTYASYGAAYGSGDIIGVALNMDVGEVTFYKNGVSQGVAFNTGLSGKTIQATVERAGGFTMSWTANFGQRPFAYTAPSGFKALCDTNLPAPVVAKSSGSFDIALYTGNSSTQSITLPGGMSPDLVWVKTRSAATYYHALYDAVRGTGPSKSLYSNATDAEGAQSIYTNLTSFDSSGFSLGSTSPNNNILNQSGQTFVAWCWDAGSSTVTNTQGSITSSVRVNASAGFSVVSWTSNAASQIETLGHGLGVTPTFIIVKNRDVSDNWIIYHASLSNPTTSGLYFTTGAAWSSSPTTYWSTSSTTFGVRQSSIATANTQKCIAYCWTPVAGYTSISSFVGNNSTDGTFVYTGHRVRWLLLKNATSAGTSWVVFDSARSSYNVVGQALLAHSSSSELSGTFIDFLSNGFKLRVSSDPSLNNNGDTYIYMAIAESPFQYARAR